jgi:hypothetical protein
LLLGAMASLAISFFSYQSALDIHLHDTYYEIRLNYVCWCFALIHFVFALLYKSLHRLFFSRIIGWFHVLITVLALLTVLLFSLSQPRPEKYLDWNSFKAFETQKNIEAALFIIFVLAQLTFLLNLVIGYFVIIHFNFFQNTTKELVYLPKLSRYTLV